MGTKSTTLFNQTKTSHTEMSHKSPIEIQIKTNTQSHHNFKKPKQKKKITEKNFFL